MISTAAFREAFRKLDDDETHALRVDRHVRVDSPETLLVNFDCTACGGDDVRGDDEYCDSEPDDFCFVRSWHEVQTVGWPDCQACGEPAVLVSAYRQTGPVPL